MEDTKPEPTGASNPATEAPSETEQIWNAVDVLKSAVTKLVATPKTHSPPFHEVVKEVKSFKNPSGLPRLPIRDAPLGALQFNEMIGLPVIEGVPISDTDIDQLRAEYSKGLAWRVSVEDLWRAVTLVAKEHPVHPVRAYLTGVKWDGEQRIRRVLSGILRCPMEEDAALKRGPREKLYEKMLRAFFIGAVARAFRPGCKVDTTLVLQGIQGSRKSTFFATLAGEGWYTCTDLDIGDTQTTPMIMGRSWLCEWAELESLKRAREMTQAKAFLSRACDDYRPPYARAVVSHPRSSVIVGSTNEDAFLSDTTGNRRFHIIKVGDAIDIDLLARWRDQLWGEAVAAYLAGEKWWLDGAEEKLLLTAQEDVFLDHPWTGAVELWLSKNVVSEGGAEPKPVTTENVLLFAIGKDTDKQTRADQMAVGGILRRLGYQVRRVTEDGVRYRVWVRPGDEAKAGEVPGVPF